MLKSLSSALLLLLALGCKGGAPEEEAAPPEGAPTAEAVSPVDEATAATITGRILFQGTPPPEEKIDMSEEPDCADMYPEGAYTQRVEVNPDGTLKDVFVYVKEGLPADLEFPTPSAPVTIDQKGCRYHPHVLGIQADQPLRILNSDPLLHNIHAKPEINRSFNVSQPTAGLETTRKFSKPEVLVRVECDVHGWMLAFVAVLTHPYYSVTGEDGSFTIKGLPPGEYVIEAWQETYGTQTMTVTVGPQETKEIEFTYTAS